MIHEVDDVLRSLIRAEVLEGGQIAVVFDAPTREWAAKVNAPMVNLYLYDIREDMKRRERGLHNEYDEHGTVVARRRPPRYFKLSYLITAWTKRPEDEHRLLSSLLACLLRYEALPPERLTGSLAEIGAAVPMSIALPPPEDRSFADVWSALGGELKPSLDLVISVPVTASPTYVAGPPVGDEGLRARFGDVPTPPERPRQPMPGRGPGLPVYGSRPGRPGRAAVDGSDGRDGPDGRAGSDGRDRRTASGTGEPRRGLSLRITENRGAKDSRDDRGSGGERDDRGGRTEDSEDSTA
ncbi:MULTISPECIES: Pvc16 family protein [unclassified Streptomyces]|uniref:Pvc16 family protein n=1 Tax=Streptomyces sp. NPDC127532 TaxID=3345399 RepID=UPI0036357957